MTDSEDSDGLFVRRSSKNRKRASGSTKKRKSKHKRKLGPLRAPAPDPEDGTELEAATPDRSAATQSQGRPRRAEIGRADIARSVTFGAARDAHRRAERKGRAHLAVGFSVTRGRGTRRAPRPTRRARARRRRCCSASRLRHHSASALRRRSDQRRALCVRRSALRTTVVRLWQRALLLPSRPRPSGARPGGAARRHARRTHSSRSGSPSSSRCSASASRSARCRSS